MDRLGRWKREVQLGLISRAGSLFIPRRILKNSGALPPFMHEPCLRKKGHDEHKLLMMTILFSEFYLYTVDCLVGPAFFSFIDSSIRRNLRVAIRHDRRVGANKKIGRDNNNAEFN